MRKIYVASSWRNPNQQHIVQLLRSVGHEVYDFRHPAPGNEGFHWSDVNPNYKDWAPEEFIKDLTSGNSFVTKGFYLDSSNLAWCDTLVCLLPCGRSAHLEAGYASGKGKDVCFYLSKTDFEPELMYLLGSTLVANDYDLIKWIQGLR